MDRNVGVGQFVVGLRTRKYENINLLCGSFITRNIPTYLVQLQGIRLAVRNFIEHCAHPSIRLVSSKACMAHVKNYYLEAVLGNTNQKGDVGNLLVSKPIRKA